MDEITVRPAAASEWSRLKTLRLEMLADTPSAYVETLSEAEARSDVEWMARAERSTHTHAVSMIAEDELGRWVGGMVCYRDPERFEMAWLVAVYVQPGSRGRGVSDQLLDAVESWARDRADLLHLHVTEDNECARRFYTRRGYVATGEWEPNTHDPFIRDLEFSRPLR